MGTFNHLSRAQFHRLDHFRCFLLDVLNNLFNFFGRRRRTGSKFVCRAIWLIKETTLEICWDDSPSRLTFFAVPATVSRKLRIFCTVRSIANPPVSAVVEAVRATAAA